MGGKKLTAALAAALTLSMAFNGQASETRDEPRDVVRVQVPSNLDFTIDPFEIDGRGQIYSDEYIVKNLGDTNIFFDIIGIDISYSDYDGFEPFANPFGEDFESDRKAIYMEMEFNKDYLEPIVLTDPYGDPYLSVALDALDGYEDERSELSFGFSGNVNANPANNWRKGDVTIELVYSVEALYPEGSGGYDDQYIIETAEPVIEPTAEPIIEPTPEPVIEPTAEPIIEPTAEPVIEPTPEPIIIEPTAEPIIEPTAEPVIEPTAEPVIEPTPEPVIEPTAEPVMEPTPEPITEPTPEPVTEPTPEPIIESTPEPITEPAAETAPESYEEPAAEPSPETPAL